MRKSPCHVAKCTTVVVEQDMGNDVATNDASSQVFAAQMVQAVPDTAQAEACFQQALDVARHQQAKSLELRAAMSLAKLWQSQDKRQDAYDLLAPVYHWFTEGFDTADLQDAKALLEELA